jgi:adenosylcobinamide-phosphate synthase
VSIILALLIDRWWGEPPGPIHPVVWMGSYLKHAGRDLPNHGPRLAFLLGSLAWLAGAGLVAVVYGYLAWNWHSYRDGWT